MKQEQEGFAVDVNAGLIVFLRPRGTLANKRIPLGMSKASNQKFQCNMDLNYWSWKTNNRNVGGKRFCSERNQSYLRASLKL